MTLKAYSGLGLASIVGLMLVMFTATLQAENAAGVSTVGSAIKLTANGGAANDQFGVAVAIDGNRVVIGAEGHDDGESASSQGAAYVFRRNNSDTWVANGNIVASDGEALDGFGHAVDIDNDTQTVIVGAYTDDVGNNVDAGSAYVYTRSGGNWVQQGVKLVADDASANAQFGAAVAIEGTRALVGAPGAGVVYEFTFDGNNWTQQDQFVPGTQVNGDRFGVAVDLEGDTALVGAESRGNDGIQGGSAYIFTTDGNSWTQRQRFNPSSPVDQGFFGASVALKGTSALIGAYFENANNSTTQSGAAYVFTGSGNNWTEQARLTASDADALDSFGYSVALSGNTAVIGAPLKTESNRDKSGAVYIFDRDTNGNWTQSSKLTTDDGAARDALGFSVALFGTEAILGAIWDDSFQGAAYLFPAAQAAPEIILVAPTGTENDPNSDLVMTFDEPVFKGTGTIQILNSNSGIVEEMAISDDTVTLEGNQVTINPSTLLNYGETYEIVIPNGAFVDADGAPFAGLGTGN